MLVLWFLLASLFSFPSPLARCTKISLVRSLDTKTFSLKVQIGLHIIWMRHTVWHHVKLSHSHVRITLTWRRVRVHTYRVDNSEKICHFLWRYSLNREKCDVWILKWPIWELYSTELHHFWAQLNNDYEWNGISMQFEIIFQWHHPQKLIIIKVLSHFLYEVE